MNIVNFLLTSSIDTQKSVLYLGHCITYSKLFYTKPNIAEEDIQQMYQVAEVPECGSHFNITTVFARYGDSIVIIIAYGWSVNSGNVT